MSEEFQIKGSTILSKLDFAEEHLGEGAKQDLEQHLQAAGFYTVLAANWYPFELYDGVLRFLAANYLGGDISRLQEVGAFSAEKALSTTYEPYAMRRDFLLFLKRISALHSRFYNAGRLVVVSGGESSCHLELIEAPAISLADVHVAEGFYTGAAKLMGLERARCSFVVDSDRVRYRLDWS